MDNKCELCKIGTMHRNHTCEDYVVWTCDNRDPKIHYEFLGNGCPNQELEHFSDMDDEGWAWLRNYYKKS